MENDIPLVIGGRILTVSPMARGWTDAGVPSTAERDTVPIDFDLRFVTRAVWISALLLIASSATMQVLRLRYGHDTIYGLVRLLDMDFEASIPAWYTSSLMLFAAMLLALTALMRKSVNDPSARRWALMSVVFVYLSADETVQLHEKFSAPVNRFISFGNVPDYAWVVAGAVLVIVVGLYFLPFVLRLPRRTRNLVLLSGAIYVSGALGMEVVGAYFNAVHGSAYHGSVLQVVMVMIEESLEILGLVVFVVGVVVRVSKSTVTRVA
jgi:hypothetical protein